MVLSISTDQLIKLNSSDRSPWKIMIVDDDAAAHEITKFALQNRQFGDSKVEFVDAHSSQEALALLKRTRI